MQTQPFLYKGRRITIRVVASRGWLQLVKKAKKGAENSVVCIAEPRASSGGRMHNTTVMYNTIVSF